MFNKRKNKIIVTAMEHARAHSYLTLKRTEVAEAAGVAVSLVSHHFGDIAGLRDEVMRRAVAESDLVIIAQGLTNRDPIAIDAPEPIKRAALSALYDHTAAGVR